MLMIEPSTFASFPCTPLPLAMGSGSWFLGVMVLVGLFKSAKMIGRPGINRLGPIAVSLALLAWLIGLTGGGLLTLLQDGEGVWQPGAQLFVIVLAAVVYGAMPLTAIILGILAFVVHDRQRHEGGRGMAVWALVVGTFLLLAWGFVVFYGDQFARLRETARELSGPSGTTGADGERLRPSGEGTTLTFDDLNFRFRTPGKPWFRMPRGTIKTDAQVMMQYPRPQIVISIIAERLGISAIGSTQDLEKLCHALLEAQATDCRFSNRTEEKLGPLDCVRFQTEATMMGQKILYEHCLAIHNGYAYQLITFGNPAHRRDIRDAARLLRERFSLIDPDRIALDESEVPLGRWESKPLGFTVDLKGKPWIRNLDMEKGSIEVEVSGWQAREEVGGYVAAVCYGEERCDMKALTRMALASVGATPQAQWSIRREFRDGDRIGRDLTLLQDLEGTEHEFRLRILAGPAWAHVLGTWAAKGNPRLEPLTEEFLAAVRIRPDLPDRLDAAGLTERQRQGQARMLNQIGLEYHGAGEYRKTLAYFLQAVRLHPGDVDFIANVLSSRNYLGEQAEGLAWLDALESPVKSTAAVRAWRAWLLNCAERHAEAAEVYVPLFAEGHRSGEDMCAYLRSLSALGKWEAAKEAADRYLKDGDARDVRLAMADVLYEHDRYGEGVAWLKLMHDGPAAEDSEVATQMCYHHLALREFAQVLEIAEALRTADGDSATAWYLVGEAQFGLERYEQARASYERAAVLAPESKTVQDALQRVWQQLNPASPASQPAVPEPTGADAL